MIDFGLEFLDLALCVRQAFRVRVVTRANELVRSFVVELFFGVPVIIGAS